MPSGSKECLFCGGVLSLKRPFKAKGAGPIGLYKCQACKAEALLPQPDDAELLAEYRGYYEKRSRLGAKDFPKEEYFAQFLRKYLGASERAKDFCALELGSGSGDFVKAFNSLYPNARITAVEQNPEAAKTLKRLNCEYVPLPIDEFLDKRDVTYDAIFMFDVLEHLRDPSDALEKVSLISRPGAKIYMSAPFVNTWSHGLMGRHWWQYKTEHLYYFSNTSFERMGKRAGLSVKEILPLKKRLSLSYLVSVAAMFSPLGRMASALLPEAMYDLKVSLPLGEALVIYEKPGKVTAGTL